MYTDAQLAEITHLTNLDRIADDPAALVERMDFAASMRRHLVPDAPLRLKVALDEYRERALALYRAAARKE